MIRNVGKKDPYVILRSKGCLTLFCIFHSNPTSEKISPEMELFSAIYRKKFHNYFHNDSSNILIFIRSLQCTPHPKSSLSGLSRRYFRCPEEVKHLFNSFTCDTPLILLMINPTLQSFLQTESTRTRADIRE